MVSGYFPTITSTKNGKKADYFDDEFLLNILALKESKISNEDYFVRVRKIIENQFKKKYQQRNYSNEDIKKLTEKIIELILNQRLAT
ncbi:MAG: hypothetical protein ACTSP3_10880 [Candidatus Heimdallarchaeaceae archaeon]